MCSIIGYLGYRNAAPLLVRALQRMEYRGYDSAGAATVHDGRIIVKKDIGKVAEVNDRLRLTSLPGKVGIGHTRWATHGGVTGANAHPHISTYGSVAIVHNGVIDNYQELKEQLTEDGFFFKSQTDSEVIANLLELNYDQSTGVKRSMIQTVSRLEGKYSFVAMFEDGTLAAARYHEPLIVGIGKDGIFIGSDVMGFVENTDEVIYLDNREMAFVSDEGLSISDFNETPMKHHLVKISREFGDASKGDYVHYTLKEIYEQPETILRAGGVADADLAAVAELLGRARSVYVTGSGTSFHAALIGKYLFSKFARKTMEPVISSEAQFSPVQYDDDSVLIAISQSGESADVLEAVSIAREKGCKTISLVNVMTSSLVRLSDRSVGLKCGPEIGVAATKSYTSQLAVLYRLADRLCGGAIGPDLEGVSKSISHILFNHAAVRELAKEISSASDIYILGMGIHYFTALEASLKLKELAYIHAEALPGGELKHGPLALVDPTVYVIVINPNDSTYTNTMTSVHEVKARGAKVIGVSDRPHEIYDHWIRIPTVPEALLPLVEVVPLQLLSYYTALERNANPDYPRNLAKSVTVK